MNTVEVEDQILKAVSVAVSEAVKAHEMEFPSKAVLSLCQAYATLKAAGKR